MRIVQLSDLHLAPHPLPGGIDAWTACDAALQRVAALRPDALVLSGDLADAGDFPTYRQLASRLAGLALPYYLLPGNHDMRDALRATFPGQGWGVGERLCQRIDFGELSLLLIDTVVPGADWGEFAAAQLAWLSANCPLAGRVVLVMHQPPFSVGIPGMDALACRGGELLAEWLAGRPQVEALWCGHVHRAVNTVFAGKMASTAPSTVHQIAYASGPLAWTPEPPGLLLHEVFPGAALRTHYLPLQAAPVFPY